MIFEEENLQVIDGQTGSPAACRVLDPFDKAPCLLPPTQPTMRMQLDVRRVRTLGGLHRPPLFAALFACTAAFPAVPASTWLPGLATGGRAWRVPQRLRGGVGEDVMKRERLGQHSMYMASAKGGGVGGKEPGLNAVQAMLLECGFAFGSSTVFQPFLFRGVLSVTLQGTIDWQTACTNCKTSRSYNTAN